MYKTVVGAETHPLRLPHALVITSNAETDERCGRKYGQQAKSHHRREIVLSSVAHELTQEKIGSLWDDGHPNKPSAQIGPLGIELGAGSYSLRQLS
jgi:hypothetical protein